MLQFYRYPPEHVQQSPVSLFLCGLQGFRLQSYASCHFRQAGLPTVYTLNSTGDRAERWGKPGLIVHAFVAHVPC